MMKKYQHIERITGEDMTDELKGLNTGVVYAYTKLDGANHSIWFDEDKGVVKCSSRNQEVNEGWDSTGFFKYFKEHPLLEKMAIQNKDFVFYGEFLTKHTIKDYDDDAYGEWYLFDMYDKVRDIYIPYEFYSKLAGWFNVQCIPPICKLKDPSYEEMKATMSESTFLHNGQPGEGVVFKNYEYRNSYGRQTWGKLVDSDFKVNSKTKGKGFTPEQLFVQKYMTAEFVSKEVGKYLDENGGSWTMELMPLMLKQIAREFSKDYAYELLTEFPEDKIDRKALSKAIGKEGARYLCRYESPAKQADC